MAGPFYSASASEGSGIAGGAEVYTGKGSHDQQVTGGNGFVGVGVGVSGWAGKTNTWVKRM